jgi:hypothetical protein
MNTKASSAASESQADRKTGKKASTNELPMTDLDTVLGFVERIEGEGLQTLSQQDVAKRLGYASQTSTPFYRRIVAAKLFGLLDTTQGVNLTRLALDYFKPTDEDSKKQALATAVRNVLGYQGLVERFSGKRLPPLEILGNFIERQFGLTADRATACADVFVRSVNRAGLVKADGSLGTNPAEPIPPKARAESAHPVQGGVNGLVVASSAEATESHYLTLDAKRNRRVIVQAPPIITSAELKRLQNWLAVQLHVVETLEEGPENPTIANGTSNVNTTGET